MLLKIDIPKSGVKPYDIIYWEKVIHPSEKKEQQLKDMFHKAGIREFLEGWIKPEIISEDNLKKAKILVIEINTIDRMVFPMKRTEPEPPEPPHGVGIVDVRLCEKTKTLRGTRVLKCGNEWQYRRMVFQMDLYRKWWRAWNKMPETSPVWM